MGGRTEVTCAESAGLDSLVGRLARRVTANPDSVPPRSIVVVGAASTVPGWAAAHDALACALKVAVPVGRSAADIVRHSLSEQGSLGDLLFWRAYSTILLTDPPVGYAHLANLASGGYIDVVLTTTWDPLLEIAFSKVLQPSEYRVLTRGEFGDGDFAQALLQRGIPQIVKLNGDLHSSLVTSASYQNGSSSDTPAVVEALQELFAGALVMSEDVTDPDTEEDIRKIITTASGAGTRCQAASMLRISPHYEWFNQYPRMTGSALTDFDILMIQLDRQIQLAAPRRSAAQVRPVHADIIKSVELNAASIPPSAVDRHIQSFAENLANAELDWIACIDDPLAPGGAEVIRRLALTTIGRLPQFRVSITAQGGNRMLGRRAALPRDLRLPRGAKVALIDSVAFSGSTLHMAAQALTSQFEGLVVIPAVLIASRGLVNDCEAGRGWLSNLIYERVTERHDLSFPWGSTFATGTVSHNIEYGPRPRSIKVFRRPWGSGEIYADSENCSVRILAIDAGQQLSFQRHLARDELFVALDNNIGIDLSSDSFDDEAAGRFEDRIDSVALAEGDYLLIPRGTWHRLRSSTTRVRVLEVSFGIYDEDFDIERLLDLYGRARRM
jgi:mannose-6-phosphate isomerase